MSRLPNNGKVWLAQDDEDLWQLRGLKVPLHICAKRLGRSYYSVEIRWRLLRKQRGKEFTTLPPLASAS